MSDLSTRVNTITDTLKKNAYAILQWSWGVVILTIMVMAFLTMIYGKSQPKSLPAPQAAPQVAEQAAPMLSTDAMLDSMVRAWTDKNGRFKKVCYDAPSKDKYGFFIQYGPKGPSDGDEMLDEGWWYAEQEFFRTSAGKYYTNDIAALDKSMHVYPDVTGLSCKDR